MYQPLSITIDMCWAVFAQKTWNGVFNAFEALAQQVALAGFNSYVISWNPMKNVVNSATVVWLPCEDGCCYLFGRYRIAEAHETKSQFTPNKLYSPSMAFVFQNMKTLRTFFKRQKHQRPLHTLY